MCSALLPALVTTTPLAVVVLPLFNDPQILAPDDPTVIQHHVASRHVLWADYQNAFPENRDFRRQDIERRKAGRSADRQLTNFA
jgi:hypothetical protein